MRIHYIIHAGFEKLGVIEQWAFDRNYRLTSTHSYRQERLPQVSDFDFLILMGGPQSTAALDKYPYLADEIALTKTAIAQGKAVLGICLGAQIIGEALGAKSQLSPHKEIGVYPIELTEAGKSDPIFSKMPMPLDVMHWHGEMPGIAQSAVLLAKSAGCPHQAFRVGTNVYGLQFHLEMTNELLKAMVQHAASDITDGKYVQRAEQLRELDLSPMAGHMRVVLDYLAQQVMLHSNAKTLTNAIA